MSAVSALMPLVRAFGRDRRGASSVEFVLVLPVVALMIFGMFDVGMFAWRINMLEKATQAGARYAAVTDVVPSNLVTTGYVGRVVSVNGSNVTLEQGDPIPAEALDPIDCSGAGTTTATSVTCTCLASTQAPCPTPGNSLAAFNAILARMRVMDPSVNASNLMVQYRGSGLGYAGDPDGMEVSPLVTVRLRNMIFRPLTGYLFRLNVNLPDFAYSLTMEDGSGTRSN